MKNRLQLSALLDVAVFIYKFTCENFDQARAEGGGGGGED